MTADPGSPADATVYRADVVGSMLRPDWLVEARQRFRAGTLAPEAYRETEDRAVAEAISIQEQAGVDVVTDGEMRRDIFFDLFVSGLTGLSPVRGHTVRFQGKRPEDAMEVEVPFAVTGKISPRSSPALEQFLAARDLTGHPLKVTLPSPMLIGGFWAPCTRRARTPIPSRSTPRRPRWYTAGCASCSPPDAATSRSMPRSSTRSMPMCAWAPSTRAGVSTRSGSKPREPSC